MSKNYSLTYQIATEESREDGEFEDHGFLETGGEIPDYLNNLPQISYKHGKPDDDEEHDRNIEFSMTDEEREKFISKHGFEWPDDARSWMQTEEDVDIETGVGITYCLHEVNAAH